MNIEKLHQLHELSGEAWKWFRMKDQVEVKDRDDLFWNEVVNDIAKMVSKVKYPEFETVFKDLLNAYAGQLQKNYKEYIDTKQEKLPI